MQLTRQHFNRHQIGFTLAELLIALGILAIIAVFSIPKMLNSATANKDKAAFKEVIGTLSAITYEGVIKKELTLANSGTYFLERLQAAKVCPVNSYAEGCFTQPLNGVVNDINLQTGGVLLHNGVSISSLDDNCCTNGAWPNGAGNGILIDINGVAGPNLYFQDQISITASYGTAPYFAVSPGRFALNTGSPFQAMYESLLQ